MFLVDSVRLACHHRQSHAAESKHRNKSGLKAKIMLKQKCCIQHARLNIFRESVVGR